LPSHNRTLPSFLNRGVFWIFFFVLYTTLLHLRPIDSTVSEDAGIKPKTVVTWHWQFNALTTRLYLIHTRLDLIPPNLPCHLCPAVANWQIVRLLNYGLNFFHQRANFSPELSHSVTPFPILLILSPFSFLSSLIPIPISLSRTFSPIYCSPISTLSPLFPLFVASFLSSSNSSLSSL
jgi:hypothetical protein